ncbi:MAG: YihA family ribosome biogenesis GTP-binding protein [Acetobacter sp.]|nr:YihA family ribosome biogenesis GTP-binding protein [Acetobacter sp.]
MVVSFRELKTVSEKNEAFEKGRQLFAGECQFVFGTQRLEQLPPQTLPEIAFAGRSNVGKSSLINALTGRRALARASSEPGRTQQLNFFNLASRLMLVDMPGYGYARVAKSVKEDWQRMMFDYLRGRPILRRVVVLLDARVELKKHDKEVMHLLDAAAVSFQVVLTKCDALSVQKLAVKQAEVDLEIRSHPAAFPYLSMTSSQTGLGVDMLRAELAEFARRVV